MKIKAKAKALAQIMTTVARAASPRSTTPILACVLFEAKDGTLTVAAGDMEISVRVACAAPIERDGATAVNARLLSNIVRSLPPEKDLVFQADEKGATLTCSGGSYTMRVYSPNDFPRPALFPDEGAFTIPVKTLAEGVEKVSVATANDDNRPVLGAVSASIGAGRMRLVSTDSYRLALYDAPIEGGPEEHHTALIPARALREAVKLAAGVGDVEKMDVAFTKSGAHFKVGPIEFSSRLVAGAFPDYDKLMPKSFERTYSLDVAPLKETLARVNLFAARQSPPVPVKLAFTKSAGLEGGELVVAVKSAEIGEAKEKIGVEVKDEFAAAFNGSYLSDGIASVGHRGRVTISFNDPMKPAIIASVATDEQKSAEASSAEVDNDQKGPGKALYLVMPMRDPDQAA